MRRRRISTGTPWEMKFGYSRAVVAGDLVFVSGTVASDEMGRIQHPGDAYKQAKYILAKIGAALAEAGASLDDVVRVRMHLTRIADLEAVGRAHGEAFCRARPACTGVEVSALASPDCLVEIEVDAILPAPSA